MKCRTCCNLFFATLVFIKISDASAIIGENPEQSFLRYGAPVKSYGDNKVYRKAGLQIIAHFYEGLTDKISYKKYLPGKSEKLEEISFEEIAVLLDNNSRGDEWKGLAKQYKEDELKQRSWACKSIPIEATYDDTTNTLLIFATDLKKLQEIYMRKSKVDHEKLINTLGV